MKQHFQVFLPALRRSTLLLWGLVMLLLLSACTSYSPSRSYSSGYYSYQARAGYYYPDYVYYGAYQPGWFVAAPYFPGNYWGYGAMVYWPTYSSSYYYSNHYYGSRAYYGRYYPYSDPWYYPYSGHYRHVYGHYFGPYNGPYYSYGVHYGSRHRDAVDEGLRQRNSYQPELRSATVVDERAGIYRSVGVAPGRDGSQGMVISNRNDRKVRPSRMHSAPNGNSAPVASQAGKSWSGNRIPQQPGTPQPEPVYQHQPDSRNPAPQAGLRQSGDRERGQPRNRERDRSRQ